jgi:hypothetical protein
VGFDFDPFEKQESEASVVVAEYLWGTVSTVPMSRREKIGFSRWPVRA